MTNFRTKTRTLIIAIMLAIVSIACFSFASVSFNQSVSADEQTYTINYVDQAGRLIKTETTTIGNLSGADKEGYTATYSVQAIAGLPFFEIDCNPEEKLTYPEVSYNEEMWGNNLEDLLKYYTDSNNEKEEERGNAEIEYFNKYGHNSYTVIKNTYAGINIEFFFPATDLATRNDTSNNELPHDFTFLINDEEIDFRTNYREHSLINGSYHFPSSVESEWNTAKPYDMVVLQLTNEVKTVKLVEFNGITEENFETKINSLSDVTEAHANKGEIYIKVMYDEIIPDPTPTPNEPTTDDSNEPNAFVSFFKDNAKALTTQFMALGNGDFNTAFKSGWQLYCFLVACVAFILVLTLSLIALNNKIYKKKARRKSKKIKE